MRVCVCRSDSKCVIMRVCVCVCVCVRVCESEGVRECVCMFMWFMRTQICIMTWV